MRIVVACVVSIATTARAAPGDDLSLAPGEVDARLVTELDLVYGAVARPTSFAPDVWFGATPRLTIGITHSDASLDRVAVGGGVCIDRGTDTCEPYRGPNLDVRWRWREDVAPRARFLVRDLDPVKPAVTVGALVRWRRGGFAVDSDPYVQIALAKRREGNRDRLVLPLWFGAHATPNVFVGGHTGWDSDLAVVRDGWHVPIAAVVRARVSDEISIAAEAGWPSLLGPQNDFKLRAAFVSVGWQACALARCGAPARSPGRR